MLGCCSFCWFAIKKSVNMPFPHLYTWQQPEENIFCLKEQRKKGSWNPEMISAFSSYMKMSCRLHFFQKASSKRLLREEEREKMLQLQIKRFKRGNYFLESNQISCFWPRCLWILTTAFVRSEWCHLGFTFPLQSQEPQHLINQRRVVD